MLSLRNSRSMFQVVCIVHLPLQKTMEFANFCRQFPPALGPPWEGPIGVLA